MKKQLGKNSKKPSSVAAACTIITRCYLSHAKILADSYFKHEPGGRFYLLIVDRLPRGEKLDPRIVVVEPEDLGIDYFYEMCFKYNVTELCTAVKPPLLAHLLKRDRDVSVTYFDPDILIMRPLHELREALAQYDIILTPHLLTPIPLDGMKPTEQDILRDGIYNLGFIAVRDSKSTREFLGWWSQRLRDMCRMDPSSGLFTDQKWINLVPDLFPSVHVLREDTYNIAYWNLHARKITRSGNGYLVNGRPIAFYHFSGFNPAHPQQLSKHQTRTKIVNGTALARLLEHYAKLHQKAGHVRSSSWEYGYLQFDDGTPLDNITRQLYLQLNERRRRRFGDPFHANGKTTFLGWATRHPGKSALSPFLESIYRRRADVMTAFPDVRRRDRASFLNWAKSQGAIELGYDPRLVDPNARATRNRSATSAKATIVPRTKPIAYPQLVRRIRATIHAHVPANATVSVINKGDADLLRLGRGRTAWHFPQSHDGKYGGHYPVNSAAAVAHLEALRAKGAAFLVIPQTAFWWLKHYERFAEHLASRYRIVVRQSECIIFSLGPEAKASRSNPSADELKEGVNVSGYISSEKGLGEGVRSDIRCLKAARIPHVLNNFIDSGSRNVDRAFTRFSTENPYRVNLIHINADQLDKFAQAKGPDYFRGRYNVGYWAWELSDFPSQWHTRFQYLDEVWVPSTFVLDSISRVSNIPVVKIPHAIPVPLATRPLTRAKFGIPDNRCVFLFVFDIHSFVERKNPLGLIEAFSRAFKPGDDATLLLKCSHASERDLAPLREAARGIDLRIIDDVLDRPELNTLIALADCYVSLHRSEGFGLTIAEAMALGKPVIATAYSGNMDFMTLANSFPVSYQLTEIQQDHGPYRKGCVWADPDLDHAAELMRRVYVDRETAARIGRAANESVTRQLSPAAVGEMMRDRLHAIGDREIVVRPAPSPVLAVAPADRRRNEYAEMLGRIRETIRKRIPRDATVAVISKGDEALLNLEGRRAWHFPRAADGSYSGYYPADSEAAIRELEEACTRGATHLLVPGTAHWWLDHYAKFAAYLNRYERVYANDDCVAYALSNLNAIVMSEITQVSARDK